MTTSWRSLRACKRPRVWTTMTLRRSVGLKLLGDVVLTQRANPLFEPLREPLHAFIRKLKSQVSQAA
ncbi:MAG: DUF3861 family protein [Ideonella sp.]|nr:DUF3861 family protein [Ideonella sp.]